MNRRDLFRVAGGAVAASAIPRVAASEIVAPIASSAPPQEVKKYKPHTQLNLLFLFTDQQRQDTLACYGNHTIKVPNLNRLASKSVVFHACYCTQPICTPSRGSLLTGLWPHTHGEYTNNVALGKNIPVLVEMLPKRKYYTAYFGKWHLGNEIFRQHGFDEFESTEDIYDTYYSKGEKTSKDVTPKRTRSGYYRFLIEHNQKPGPDGEFSREFSNKLPEELSKPAYLAQTASNFLAQNYEKPWVMYVNFLDPHTPFNSAFDNMYDPKKMEVPASFDQPTDPKELDRTRAVRNAIQEGLKNYEGIMDSDDAVRLSKAHYWGKVSLVDKMVGRILAKLEETNQAENTIIVFTTDHGEMMGDHHLMFKSVMYEEASKVPMLLKIPGMALSHDIKQPVSHIDVVPTLLDLMGEELPVHLQGNSWAPYLKENEGPPERNVIVEWNGAPWPFDNMPAEPLRTLRTNDGWKMTLAPAGEGELYNLNLDPKEMHNVFYDAESLERIQRFTAEINLWQKATGDAALLFDEAGWQKRKAQFIKANAK